MISYNNKEVGWEVKLDGDRVYARSLKVFNRLKIDLPISDFSGLELRFTSKLRSTAGANHQRSAFGFVVWLVHSNTDISVPIYSKISGTSPITHGNNDVKLEVRQWAENFAKDRNIPILRRNLTGQLESIPADQLDIPLRDRLDRSQAEEVAQDFVNHSWFKWKDHPDHLELSISSRKAAIIQAVIIEALAVTLFFVLPENLWPLSLVIGFIGILVIIWGIIKTNLKIYSDRFEFKSSGMFGMAKKNVVIPFAKLEDITIDKNPGLNGVNSLCFCSDSEIFYLANGNKRDKLDSYVGLFSLATVNFEKFREIALEPDRINSTS